MAVRKSKWDMPPRVVENNHGKIMWDFQIQTEKLVIANHPNIVLVEKQRKMAVVIHVSLPSDSNVRRKEHENTQGRESCSGVLLVI